MSKTGRGGSSGQAHGLGSGGKDAETGPQTRRFLLPFHSYRDLCPSLKLSFLETDDSSISFAAKNLTYKMTF